MQNITTSSAPLEGRSASIAGTEGGRAPHDSSEASCGEPVEVLLVEDNPEYAALVERALERSRPPMRVRRAGSLGEALDRTREWTPAVILLDLTLPDADPSTTILHAGGLARRAPLFVLTAHSDRASALEALAAGVDDYFVKEQLDPKVLVQEVREALERRHGRARGHEAALSEDAFTEELESRCHAGEPFAVTFVELDNFATLRELWGDAWALRMRRSTGEVLARSLGEADALSRLGDSTFAILHPREVFSTSFGTPSGSGLSADVSHREMFSAVAHCGTAWFPEDGAHPETLLGRAEARCRQPYERDCIDLRIRLEPGADPAEA